MKNSNNTRTNIERIEPKVTLWILIIQNKLSRFLHSKLLSSVLIFYIPIITSGYLLQYFYQIDFFTWGVHFSLFWLAVAPILIQRAFYNIVGFFRDHKCLFKDEIEWKNLFLGEIKKVQSRKFLIFAIPWSIITSLTLFKMKFEIVPLAIQIWSVVSFFILFFISSYGFYGVFIQVLMMKKVRFAKINFRPYHPDKFGGLSDLGRFSVKGALYFSSGALVLPLAFEVIASISNGASIFSLLVYMLSGVFLLVMIGSFLFPIFEIKKLADDEKEKYIIESRQKLDLMIEEYSKDTNLNLKKAIDIAIYYNLKYLKLLEMKDYPWDSRLLIEFSLSFVLPIAMAITQLVLE